MEALTGVSAEAEAVLKELEQLDAIDSRNGTPKEQRVRCVTRTVGTLLNLLVLIRRPTRILELGTSAGYSTIFLASAACYVGAHVTSVECDKSKIEWAGKNLERAKLSRHVELRLGEALAILDMESGPFDFVFMDHAARLYLESFRRLRGKLSQGSVIVADGWGTVERWASEPALVEYANAIRSSPDFTTFLLPVEKGELISVRN